MSLVTVFADARGCYIGISPITIYDQNLNVFIWIILDIIFIYIWMIIPKFMMPTESFYKLQTLL